MNLIHSRSIAHVNCKIDLRDGLSENTREIIGLFPYGVKTTLRNKVREIFMRGAFDKALKTDIPRYLLYEHNPVDEIDNTLDNLEIRSTKSGVEFKAIAQRNGFIDNIKHQDFGLSIGFKATENGQFATRSKDGITNVVREAELYEISIVRNPAYAGTELEVRSKALPRWL